MCLSCGAALTGGQAPAAPYEQAPPASPRVGPETEAAPPSPPPIRFGAAARIALSRGAAAFGVLLLLGLVMGAIAPAEDAGVVDVLRGGALQFFTFHRVPVRAEFPSIDLSELQGGVEGLGGLGFGLSISLSLALAMLLATALGVWLLYRGGRAVAEAAGGRPHVGLVLGPAVALPYAILSLALAFVAVLRIELPADVPALSGRELRIAPSPPGAFLWPLLLGSVAGLAGSFGAVRHRLLAAPPRRPALAALGGGWRMLMWSLAICFVGLFVLSATNPDAFLGYFRFVGDLPAREGITVVLITALTVPNLMAALLFVGMGAPVVGSVSLGPLSFGVTLSLLRWPENVDAAALEQPDAFGVGAGAPQLPFSYGIAPPEWFFFVLAPLVGVLIGGRWAARRAGETSARRAAAVGAVAGIPFAIGGLALAVLAGISMHLEHNIPFFAGGVARGGPHLLLGALIALAWGALGGAVGGALLGRGSPGVPGAPAPHPTPGSSPG